ncbi:hypothetical protein BRADI_2g16227v3 [Brachypodium distachyon]|uniref:RRM domain-containing protein n=1 Tax=Brachypodium distachyon TaxID=15368 RepID=A0A2K2D8U9_BRADI|nr:hypothetical protein BRADI_2g16227v3 [Brachypodium distachyon]
MCCFFAFYIAVLFMSYVIFCSISIAGRQLDNTVIGICLGLLFVLNYSFCFAVQILYDRETGQSRGYGYVTMSTVEEAEMAVNTFHRRELYGKLMTVEMRSPHQHRSPVRIFVGNLPCEVDGSMLNLLFSEHGQVVDTKVAYGYVKGVWRSRRFGFVTMATREESDDAICYLHRRIWKGCKLRVEVAKGVPRRGS